MLYRQIDWNVTELGNPLGWPQELKTAINISLWSRFPMVKVPFIIIIILLVFLYHQLQGDMVGTKMHTIIQ